MLAMAAARPIDDNIYLTGDDSRAKSGLGAKLLKRRDQAFGIGAVVLFLSIWEWAGTSGAINPLFSSSP